MKTCQILLLRMTNNNLIGNLSSLECSVCAYTVQMMLS